MKKRELRKCQFKLTRTDNEGDGNQRAQKKLEFTQQSREQIKAAFGERLPSYKTVSALFNLIEGQVQLYQATERLYCPDNQKELRKLKSMYGNLTKILQALAKMELDLHHDNRHIDNSLCNENGDFDESLSQFSGGLGTLSGTEVILTKISWALKDYISQHETGNGGRPPSPYKDCVIALVDFFERRLPEIKPTTSRNGVFVKVCNLVLSTVLKSSTGDSRGLIEVAIKEQALRKEANYKNMQTSNSTK